MSGALIPFAYQDCLVRSVVRGGEPWFVGNDVCRALELRNPRSSMALLDDDEKGVHTMDTPGGLQEMIIISEPGVYRLVFTSRKKEAERFKRWLAHEVLPALRRTGRYAMPGAQHFGGLDERMETLQRAMRFREQESPGLALAAATLPIWDHGPSCGKRPAFWGDFEVRDFVTLLHRQSTLAAAVAACRARFGAERSPSRSAVHRYWLRLDVARGLRPTHVN
ncbi:MAG: BRO-N domain-containing protein [Rhabdaerophilum sp.]